MADTSPNLSTEVPRGAVISTVYARRDVKAYPVFQSEVRSFSTFNTLEKVAFSAAASFVSLAGGIWINASFTGTPTPEGTILSRVVAPGLCGLALIALILAILAIRLRKSVWLAIDKESASEAEMLPFDHA
jgi:hypothetical protein